MPLPIPTTAHTTKTYGAAGVLAVTASARACLFAVIESAIAWRAAGSTVLPDEAMTIRVGYHASERTDDILFGIAIHDENGNHLFGTNTRILGLDVPPADGDGEMSFEFHRVPLLDGTYLVTLAIQSTDEGTVYDWREQQARFEVMNPSRTNGLVCSSSMPTTESRITVERATIAPHTAFHPCFGYTWNLIPLPSVWSSNFRGSYPLGPRAALFSPGLVYA